MKASKLSFGNNNAYHIASHISATRSQTQRAFGALRQQTYRSNGIASFSAYSHRSTQREINKKMDQNKRASPYGESI
jgi:hypothetical protein